MILSAYSSNNRNSKHMKQKLSELKEEICKCTIILEDFNTPLSSTDRIIRQKISKDII